MNLSSIFKQAAGLLHIGASDATTVSAAAPQITALVTEGEAAANAVASVAGGQVATYVTAGEDLVNECVAFAQSKGVQEAEALVSGILGIVGTKQVQAAQAVAPTGQASAPAAG